MGQQTDQKRRGNPAWVKGGPSPNPTGRPRSGLALAERIRERLSPDELIDLVTKALADDSIPLRERVAFAFQLAAHGYTKPPAGLDVAVMNGASATRDLSHLSDDEVRELLARVRAPALPSATGSEPDGTASSGEDLAGIAAPRALDVPE